MYDAVEIDNDDDPGDDRAIDQGEMIKSLIYLYSEKREGNELLTIMPWR